MHLSVQFDVEGTIASLRVTDHLNSMYVPAPIVCSSFSHEMLPLQIPDAVGGGHDDDNFCGAFCRVHPGEMPIVGRPDPRE